MIKEVLNHTGCVLRLFSIFLIIPLVVSFIFGENPIPFVLVLIISLAAGQFLHQKYHTYRDVDLSKGFMIIVLSFIILSILVSIPYFFIIEGPVITIITDSLFESVSGITTSGLTVLDSLSSVPKSMLFFRSLTQWIGGIGIVIVFLFVVSQLRKSESALTNRVSSSVSLYHAVLSEDSGLDLRSLIKHVSKIYLAFTLLGIILLMISGMGIFEASAMAFTSLSTGGFVVTDAFSPSSFQSSILVFLMILGGISFFVHISLLHGNIKERFRKIFSLEPKMLAIMIVSGVLLSMIFFSDIRTAIFQVVSAFTGTGFSIADNSSLPHLMLLVIYAAMISGASMGSTCGGLKLIRVYTVFKSIPWIVKKLAVPKSVIVPFKIKGKVVDDNILIVTYTFIASYFILLLVGTVLFLILGYSFLDSSFQVVSALGTVGLSTMKISTLPVIGKLFLIAAMFLGRLEILPVLVFVRNIFVRD